MVTLGTRAGHENRSFCGIRNRRVRIAFVLRVLFVLCLGSLHVLNFVLDPAGGGSRSRAKRDTDGAPHARKLLTLSQSEVEVLDLLNLTLPPEFPLTDGPPTLETTTLEAGFAGGVNGTNGTGVREERNCTPAAIFEFPSDGFTREDRRHGWILVHVVIACYCFWLLAIVCDDYFVPAIELMCKKLQVKEDVAGATFMAAASSSPELFINCVGTFVTKGDLGVGAVVGSAVFNILAVPAVCGLLGGQVVQLRWWPVTRDSMMYGIAVIGLIGVLYDGRVMWYEATVLVSAYVLYIAAMYCNDTINRFMSKTFRRKSYIRPYTEVTEISPLLSGGAGNNGKAATGAGAKNGANGQHACDSDASDDSFEEYELATSPWNHRDDSLLPFICRWPITFILWATIPDCRRYPRLRLVTFFACIFWIGITSYFVAFLITVVGDTIDIPDSVMGLTFLAAGTSVPEAVSSIIVTNQGHGEMGISNSIGSNTFDILLCLGLPWLIKALAFPAVPGERWVALNSSGLTYSAISLLSTLCGLYLAFWFNRFKLDWKVGLTCLSMYIGFLAVSSLIELNVFFPVNLPTCPH